MPWRLKVLAWGNLFIGVITPIGVVLNILAALEVFSAEWASGSILLAAFFGAIFGYLTGRSGWGILHRQIWAYKTTCIAGGFTLGYVIFGISIMTISGRDRGLEILIRHGSQDWWNWSLSHFQHSVLREIPLLVWWVLGLGTLVRYPLPWGPKALKDRVIDGLGPVAGYGLLGCIARCFQLAQDTLLSSQR